MRISDWSSDVCSSDLVDLQRPAICRFRLDIALQRQQRIAEIAEIDSSPRRPRDRPVNQTHRLFVPPLLVGNHSQQMQRIGMVHHPMQHRRSEEHTSELQSLMRISYAVFCLKTKQTK